MGHLLLGGGPTDEAVYRPPKLRRGLGMIGLLGIASATLLFGSSAVAIVSVSAAECATALDEESTVSDLTACVVELQADLANSRSEFG